MITFKKLSKNDLPGFIYNVKVAGENPANKSGTTADRRGWCFHQPPPALRGLNA